MFFFLRRSHKQGTVRLASGETRKRQIIQRMDGENDPSVKSDIYLNCSHNSWLTLGSNMHAKCNSCHPAKIIYYAALPQILPNKCHTLFNFMHLFNHFLFVFVVVITCYFCVFWMSFLENVASL